MSETPAVIRDATASKPGATHEIDGGPQFVA